MKNFSTSLGKPREQWRSWEIIGGGNKFVWSSSSLSSPRNGRVRIVERDFRGCYFISENPNNTR